MKGLKRPFIYITNTIRCKQSKQPMPSVTPNSKPVEERYVVDWVNTKDKQYRKGIETYNTPLMTNNGRDAGQDALDELVDAGRYITQLRMENEQLKVKIEDLEEAIKWL